MDQLHQFWTDMILDHMIGHGVTKAVNDATIVAKILWGSLQMAQMMNLYQHVQFTNHPNMTDILVNWIFNKSPHKTMTKLQLDLTSIMTKYTKLQDNFDSLTACVNSMEKK